MALYLLRHKSKENCLPFPLIILYAFHLWNTVGFNSAVLLPRSDASLIKQLQFPEKKAAHDRRLNGYHNAGKVKDCRVLMRLQEASLV